MSYTNSAIIGARVPDHNEYLKDIWHATGYAVADMETFVNMRFTNMADLNSKLVGVNAPKNGMVAYVADTNQLLGYFNGWHSIYPTEKAIYTGTTVPSSSLGNVGDIYFQF